LLNRCSKWHRFESIIQPKWHFQSALSYTRQFETERKRSLLVYVTSMRRNAEAQIARDVICELLAQLQALPDGTKNLDLLIGSNGGDATVAWRIVSLIRERVETFSVLVPQAAFSAATLIALGADEIVMHPH
jgi:ClpP class serine protease